MSPILPVILNPVGKISEPQFIWINPISPVALTPVGNTPTPTPTPTPSSPSYGY